MTDESKTEKTTANRFTSLWKPVAGVAISAALVFAAIICIWLLDKYFAYKWAQSYVSTISIVFDLNQHLAEAITILVALVIALFSGMIFTFHRAKRTIGIAGIIALLVVNSLVLWIGTRPQIVSRRGDSLKCYFFNGDKVEYGERAGFDPSTGRPCRPVTPEILPRLQAYESGQRPKLIDRPDVVFFDTRNGEAIVWYSRARDGRIRLFDLMGFDPVSGTELTPMTADMVDAWQKQAEADHQLTARQRTPQRVDPTNSVFFDQVTGKPLVCTGATAMATLSSSTVPAFIR